MNDAADTMPLDELSLYLYLQVGQYLDLTPEDYQAAEEWLREDPGARSLLLIDEAQRNQEAALDARSKAREARAIAADLRATGATRRLLLRRPAAVGAEAD